MDLCINLLIGQLLRNLTSIEVRVGVIEASPELINIILPRKPPPFLAIITLRPLINVSALRNMAPEAHGACSKVCCSLAALGAFGGSWFVFRFGLGWIAVSNVSFQTPFTTRKLCSSFSTFGALS